MYIPNSTTSIPPADMVMPYTEQVIFTIATHIPFVIFMSIGLRNYLAHGDPKALFFGIGGCFAVMWEPIVDVLGFCYFPREGNWIAFETFGRPIPMFMPATYGWFVGGMGYWLWTTFQDPKTTGKDLPFLWIRGFCINLLLEYPPIYFKIYTYYGYQPLEIRGFPLWFPAVNATAPMVAATLVNLITPHLTGYKNLIIISTTATSYGIASAAFVCPIWVALGADSGYFVSYLGVGATGILLYGGIWIMSLQFKVKDLLRNSSRGSAKTVKG